MLFVAGWLIIRSGATAVQVALMVIGYTLLELALIVLALPILLTEAAFLLSVAYYQPASFRSVGAGDAFGRSAKRPGGVKGAS
jgi:hypothetical protein